MDPHAQEGVPIVSYGEKAVGLSFNPSGDKDVERIKKLFAEIIDFCNEARTHVSDRDGGTRLANNDRNRLFSIAITEAQGAQMWAVKAITWKD
jgi:hypothetical protein